MKKIVQLILALVIVGLVYVIYDQISTPIRFENVKKAKEEAVIERIKDIRTAERAFKSKYRYFCTCNLPCTAFTMLSFSSSPNTSILRAISIR